MQLRIPFLFTSFVLQQKLVGRRAESRLPLFKAIRARMAPPIAPATVVLVSAINILFARYRDVTRVVSRRIHVLWNDTTRTEIFIHQYSDDELSLTKVAKFAHISANHLSEKFKEVAGINFVDYVARIRVGKARHLLQTSNLRISEIAFAVGFQSLSQFNRVFKKLTRRSPTQSRTAHKKRAKTPAHFP